MLKFLTSFAAIISAAGLAHAQTAPTQVNPLLEFLPFIVIILIFYFLLIRPQQQRQKTHRQMIDNLKKQDIIVTQAGIIGKVTKVDEDQLTVEIADGVRVKLVRGMVAEVRNPKPANDS